jgi:hypothetical protein
MRGERVPVVEDGAVHHGVGPRRLDAVANRGGVDEIDLRVPRRDDLGRMAAREDVRDVRSDEAGAAVR